MADRQHQPSSFTARYLGKAIPKISTEYPEIIHEPLRAIYPPSILKRPELLPQMTALVTIQVFNSGISVEELRSGGNVANWYPIQNLYCSAGVIPDKDRRSIVFRKLSDRTKSSAKPVFAMVVRQPSSEGRRVLMCQAFVLDSIRDTQKLVNLTKQAYQNKSGWNHPENDKEFLNAKISYTLQRLDENHDSDLEELKVLTDKRDKQLSERPTVEVTKAHTPRRSVQRDKTSVVRREPQAQSVIVRRPQAQIVQRPQAQSVIVRSAPPTPRLMVTPPPNPMVVNAGRTAVQHDLRVPTIRARGFYQGFNTETMSDEFGSVKAASDVGFIPSAETTSNAQTNDHHLSPNMDNSFSGFSSTHRRNWSSAAPKGHRVIASSEPQELPNGFNGYAHTFTTNAEINGDIGAINLNKKGKHSKHHRPSKKTLEKYLSKNEDDNVVQINGQQDKERRVSQNSTESDSNYSITRLDNQPSTSGINGFFSTHEHADQQF